MSGKKTMALIAAIAMTVHSTAGAAAAPAAAAVPVAFDPWAVLAVLSGQTSAAAFCGSSRAVMASAAATQGVRPGGCVLPVVDAVPAPPIPAPPVPGVAVLPPPPVTGISPLLIGLGILATEVAVFFFVTRDRDHNPTNSPV